MLLTEFHKSKWTADGAAVWCKECTSVTGRSYRQSAEVKERTKRYNAEYKALHKDEVSRQSKIRRRRNKAALITMLGGACSICGYSGCIGAIEFHHFKGDKKADIGALLESIDFAQVVEEAKKCILVCANCHREIHWKELDGQSTRKNIGTVSD